MSYPTLASCSAQAACWAAKFKHAYSTVAAMAGLNWGERVAWADAAELRTNEAWSHTFETWNRGVAETFPPTERVAARTTGARVLSFSPGGIVTVSKPAGSVCGQANHTSQRLGCTA